MNFEGLHPLMTAHYRLDWLTKAKLPAVMKLNRALGHPSSLQATSEFVNETMRKIMAGQLLCWGISNRDEQLIGLVTIKNLAEPEVVVTTKINPAFKAGFNGAEVKDSIASLLSGIHHQVGTWRD
ncbi:GNAT family N-acetyltransferase [Nicoliella spurrieriana]|uniref:GNAT family N-acetyltransferase n=1 Tax=Nicoliella spurrieriana TaxID=2925830 RepID=A0A976X4Y7_9LACO|nr:GNAT family N-acetyltransferase [Nicoliella spurrieriana]UQS86265.1 GNAT family N-acetyltransferase [Nicoliella spurrieriana]